MFKVVSSDEEVINIGYIKRVKGRPKKKYE